MPSRQVDCRQGVEVESAFRDRAAKHGERARSVDVLSGGSGKVVGGRRGGAAEDVVGTHLVGMAGRACIERGGPGILAARRELPACRVVPLLPSLLLVRTSVDQMPCSASAAAVVERRGGVVARRRWVGASSDRARAVVRVVGCVVVEGGRVGAARVDGRAQARVDRRRRVEIGAGGVGAPEELARRRLAGERIEGRVRIGVVVGGGGVGAADDDGGARARDARRRVVVESNRVKAAAVQARGVVEVGNGAEVVGGRVGTAFEHDGARAVVVVGLSVEFGGARVEAAAANARAVVDDRKRTVVDRSRAGAAIGRRR